MKQLKHGIVVMKIKLGSGPWMYAQARSWIGKRVLKKRGYEKHHTFFGIVFRKLIQTKRGK